MEVLVSTLIGLRLRPGTIDTCHEYTFVYSKLQILMPRSENTHRWGKYHCMAGHQFYKFETSDNDYYNERKNGKQSLSLSNISRVEEKTKCSAIRNLSIGE